jgi:hypothetical protein
MSGYAIPVDELLAVARYQKVEFQQGDILLIRSGYISRYHELKKENPKKLEDLAHSPAYAGVEQSEEMKTFLHDS